MIQHLATVRAAVHMHNSCRCGALLLCGRGWAKFFCFFTLMKLWYWAGISARTTV